MGLTFSKSVRFGPVRFNFSGSGIGVSAGIPGLRIGTGPRGAYVSAGAHGFRYRASLNGKQRAAPSALPALAPIAPPPAPSGTASHQTRNVLALTDASAAELLNTLNSQRSRWPLFTALAVVAGLAVYAAMFLAVDKGWLPPKMPITGLVVFGLWMLGIVGGIWLDKLRRLTVLFYDLDATATRAFTSFVGALAPLQQVATMWTVTESTRYRDSKYHAGANVGVQRTRTKIVQGLPKNVRSNVSVPILTSGRTQLAFFPDRALVFQGKHIGAVAYSQLKATPSESHFREVDGVPGDSQVIGKTWKFVNKSGGPDKRFKDNRTIPICRYSNIDVQSPTGLTMSFMASKAGAFDVVPKAIALLAALERGNKIIVAHRAA